MVTLHLPPELESRLRNEAAREGLDADAFIVRTLERALPVDSAPVTSRATQREAELLEHVNLGLSQNDWRRYRELGVKNQKKTLTDNERSELIAMTDRIERANARRMPYLIQLAALRKVPLEQLMDQLGLGNGREAGGGQSGE